MSISPFIPTSIRNNFHRLKTSWQGVLNPNKGIKPLENSSTPTTQESRNNVVRPRTPQIPVAPTNSSTDKLLEARTTKLKSPKIENTENHITLLGLNSALIGGKKLRVEISESKKKTGSFIINLETIAISDITLEESAQYNVVNTTDSIKFEDMVRKWQELQTLSSSTHINFQLDENAFNFDYAIQKGVKQEGINLKQSCTEDKNTAVASVHQKSTNPKELDSLSSQHILDPSYMKDLFGYVPSKEEIELWNQEDKEFFQLFLQGAEDANLHLEPEDLSLFGSSSPAFSQENSIQSTSLTPTSQDQAVLNQYDSLQKTEISFKKQNTLIKVQKGLSFANQAVFPSLSSSATPPIEETTGSDHTSHNFYPAGGSVGEMNENLYAVFNSGLTDEYTKEEMDTQTIGIISLNNLLGLPQIWG